MNPSVRTRVHTPERGPSNLKTAAVLSAAVGSNPTPFARRSRSPSRLQ